MAKYEDRLKEFYEEKVPVFIPRPEGEPEDSVTVTLNGINYQIQYDTEALVPRKVALIVEESRRNKSAAEREMRSMAGDRPLGELR